MVRYIDHEKYELKEELPHLKGKLPFKIATTSYILADSIVSNVRFLASYVDEVELVLYETPQQGNLPSYGELRELLSISKDFGLTFNIHLPPDIFLGDPDPEVRQKACEIALRFYDRTETLDPSFYILHLDRRDIRGNPVSDKRMLYSWLLESVEYLIQQGMRPGLLAIENLDYSMDWVEPIIKSLGLTYCLDLGHILLYRLHLRMHLIRYLPRTPIVHLHGVVNGTDHHGLEGINAGDWELIGRAIRDYKGIICLEVFSLAHLSSSLNRLRGLF